jgi:hypothetical protein
MTFVFAPVGTLQPFLARWRYFLPVIGIVGRLATEFEVSVDRGNKEASARTVGFHLISRRFIDRPRYDPITIQIADYGYAMMLLAAFTAEEERVKPSIVIVWVKELSLK